MEIREEDPRTTERKTGALKETKVGEKERHQAKVLFLLRLLPEEGLGATRRGANVGMALSQRGEEEERTRQKKRTTLKRKEERREGFRLPIAAVREAD